MIYRSIRIEKGTPGYAAVNPNTNRIYICYPSSNFITVVNLDQGTIENKIQLISPGNVSVNGVTNKVYIPSANGICEIDGINNQYEMINIGLPHSGGSVDVDPRTNLLYTTCFGHDILTVIDASNQAIADKIPVGKNPKGVAVDSSTNKIYVANQESNSISIIDTESKQQVDVLDLSHSRKFGAYPEFIIANPTSKFLYIQCSGGLAGGGGATIITNLLVIDVLRKTIINNRQIHAGPPLEKATFAFNSSNNTIYLTNFSLRKGYIVLKLDATAKEVLETLHLKTKWWNRLFSIWGWTSETITFNPSTNKIYVSDSKSNLLYEIEV